RGTLGAGPQRVVGVRLPPPQGSGSPSGLEEGPAQAKESRRTRRGGARQGSDQGARRRYPGSSFAGGSARSSALRISGRARRPSPLRCREQVADRPQRTARARSALSETPREKAHHRGAGGVENPLREERPQRLAAVEPAVEISVAGVAPHQ